MARMAAKDDLIPIAQEIFKVTKQLRRFKVGEFIITEIAHSDRRKDGTPFISKKGKPYKMCKLKLDGEPFYRSGFGSYITESWEIGKKLEVGKHIELSFNGDFHNFKALDDRNYEETEKPQKENNQFSQYPTDKADELTQIKRSLVEIADLLRQIEKNTNSVQYDEAGNKLPF